MASESIAPDTKPKKVLTEAQRLAFMKGREKRLANIEKKRLEKLEAENKLEEIQTVVAPQPQTQTEPINEDKLAKRIVEMIQQQAPPKKPRKTRQPKPKADPEPESKPDSQTPPANTVPPFMKTFNWL